MVSQKGEKLMAKIHHDSNTKRLNNKTCFAGQEIAEDILFINILDADETDEESEMLILAKDFLSLLEQCKHQRELIAKLEEIIEEQEPFVSYVEEITKDVPPISMGEMAERLCNRGIDISEEELIEWLKDEDIFKDDDTPNQKYMDIGLFKVVHND